MLELFNTHNRFWQDESSFFEDDPHLSILAQQPYQFHEQWWHSLNFNEPGIYILTGGRQVGKSTSCKLLLADCLKQQRFAAQQLFYLPCDEIFDAKHLAQVLRQFLNNTPSSFLLVIDEVTQTPNWQRVIKALADEGWFQRGLCLLTGSDTVILKQAAMSFPGRRGRAQQTDFHLYPLNFYHYAHLVADENTIADDNALGQLFEDYLISGGYLKAINDLARHQSISEATWQTYEQWIRGDCLKRGKDEQQLLNLAVGLLNNGVSQCSYSKLTQNIGLMSKDTLIDYCQLLERMDIIFNLQAFDPNKNRGFPRKARKFHFIDPFIQRTLQRWAKRAGLYQHDLDSSFLVESCVASHCQRAYNSYYFKGQQGEVDVVYLLDNTPHAVEVKWANQIKSNDVKLLKQFKNPLIVTKLPQSGLIEGVATQPVWRFLYNLAFNYKNTFTF